MIEIQRDAVLSTCGLYRYRLSRWWSEVPRMVFCMLNPSTADASEDDPTIRRCMGFARREGFGGIEVVNLFPFRAMDPRNLAWAGGEGIDIRQRDRRNEAIAEVIRAQEVPAAVAAWGAHPLAHGEVASLPDGIEWECLGVTKSGAPKHPLYLPASSPLVPWGGYP